MISPLRTSPPGSVGFHDIPTELRLQIYKEALTSPSGSLAFFDGSRYSSRKDYGLVTSLLATCSNINTCATPILYASNVFLIEVKASTNINLDISFTTLPEHVLPRIQHAYVVLDTRRTLPYLSPFKHVRGNFDRLSGLKGLGISIIAPSQYLNDRIKWEGTLWTVVESVPKGCQLHFGATSDAEKAFVSHFTNPDGVSFQAKVGHFHIPLCAKPGLPLRGSGNECVEVAEEVMVKTLKKIRALQYSKSSKEQ